MPPHRNARKRSSKGRAQRPRIQLNDRLAEHVQERLSRKQSDKYERRGGPSWFDADEPRRMPRRKSNRPPPGYPTAPSGGKYGKYGKYGGGSGGHGGQGGGMAQAAEHLGGSGGKLQQKVVMKVMEKMEDPEFRAKAMKVIEEKVVKQLLKNANR